MTNNLKDLAVNASNGDQDAKHLFKDITYLLGSIEYRSSCNIDFTNTLHFIHSPEEIEFVKRLFTNLGFKVKVNDLCHHNAVAYQIFWPPLEEKEDH